MNSAVESGFADWLAGIPVTGVLKGFQPGVIPNEITSVIVDCRDVPAVVAPLHMASVFFVVTSPFHIEGGIATHKAKVAEVRAALRGYKASPSALNAALLAQGIIARGLVQKGVASSTADARWIEAIEILMGVEEAS